MFISKFLYSFVVAFVVASTLAFSGTAQASTTSSFDYGTLLSASTGYSAPNDFASDPFAHLDVTDGGSGIWTFTLQINNNLLSNFGSGAFIGDMEFNVDPNVSWKDLTTTFLGSNVSGVTSVKSSSGDCTGGTGEGCFDFGTNFGLGANNKLSQNDWVSCAKYTPVSPVPEPQTYVMLLVGLGLIGFMVHRRKNQNNMMNFA